MMLFFKSFTLRRSEINEYSMPKICFFKLEILNFSSTNKTRFDEFFFTRLLL